MDAPTCHRRWGRAIRSLFSINGELPHDRGTHVMWLAILSVMLVLPLFLSVGPDSGGEVRVGGMGLPGMCVSRGVFGVECPGCGLTRAFIHTAHGNFREALRCHRVSVLLYAFFLMQAIYHIYGLRTLTRPLPRGLVRTHNLAAMVIIALLLTNWIVGRFLGGNGMA